MGGTDASKDRDPDLALVLAGTAGPSLASDPTIQAFQAGVTLLGYETGPIDGILGPKTQAAITAYQADSDLPVTGYLTRDTS